MGGGCTVNVSFATAEPLVIFPNFLVWLTLGPTAIVSTIKRQYLMQPEMGRSYTNLVKRRLVSNTIRER